ncbi:MAG: transposase [Chloroflexi bacterium]|nr:transposase [Chloroflexota bacterium]
MPHHHDPDHPQRQSIRLRGWDYTTLGAYFITICTHRQGNLFDDPILRELAENAWRNIPTHPHACHVTLDEWVAMPNHLHGILVLEDDECRGEAGRKEPAFADGVIGRPASPLRDTLDDTTIPFDTISPLPHGVESGSIGAIIGNFKSLVTKRANQIRRTPGGKLWQRGYYDRIIRKERELDAIRQYIQDNPRRWQEDRDNLEVLVAKMRLVLK